MSEGSSSEEQSGAGESAPPGGASSGGRAEKHLVTVRMYHHPWEARLSAAKLEAAGITAYVMDENIAVAGANMYAPMVGGIKVQVEAGEAERARTMLPEGRPPRFVHCPKCQSRQTGQIPIAAALRVLYILMLGMPYVLFGVRWACTACGHSWRRSIYEEEEIQDEEDEREDDRDEPDEDDEGDDDDGDRVSQDRARRGDV